MEGGGFQAGTAVEKGGAPGGDLEYFAPPLNAGFTFTVQF